MKQQNSQLEPSAAGTTGDETATTGATQGTIVGKFVPGEIFGTVIEEGAKEEALGDNTEGILDAATNLIAYLSGTTGL